MLKRIRKGLAPLAVMAIGGAVLTSRNAAGPPARGLTVHEWGTFTTVAGEAGRAIDWFPLGGPTDLPCFVERFQNRGKLVTLPDAASGNLFDYQAIPAAALARVRMETPVLYFYSPAELTLNVRVAFPRGLMTEWFPHATVTQADVGTATLRDPSATSTIEWNDVRITPSAMPHFLQDAGGSHYYAARATDAAALNVNGQTERFLFYRGIANFDVPLSAVALEAGAIRIRNLGADPLPGVVLFESYGGRIRYRVHGALPGEATLEVPSREGSLASLRAELERMLVSAGLFQKEAAAMVATWRDSWFEEGTRVFYVLPPSSLDSILPLHIAPSPAHVARVFVGRMEVVTAETRRRVQQAAAARDTAGLEPYARFLGPVADRIAASNSGFTENQRLRQMANGLLAWYIRQATICE
jgi:hypothetical protein